MHVLITMQYLQIGEVGCHPERCEGLSWLRRKRSENKRRQRLAKAAAAKDAARAEAKERAGTAKLNKANQVETQRRTRYNEFVKAAREASSFPRTPQAS